MEYKVGDKVRVREDLEVGRIYGFIFNKEMGTLSAKSVEIISVSELSELYKIKEDGGEWNWTGEMFAGLAETVDMDKLHKVVDLVFELSDKFDKDTSLHIRKKDGFATFFDYDTTDNDGIITSITCYDLQTELDKFITDIKEHFAQFEVKEMTVAEIEKQLGHAVKIVGE